MTADELAESFVCLCLQTRYGRILVGGVVEHSRLFFSHRLFPMDASNIIAWPACSMQGLGGLELDLRLQPRSYVPGHQRSRTNVRIHHQAAEIHQAKEEIVREGSDKVNERVLFLSAGFPDLDAGGALRQKSVAVMNHIHPIDAAIHVPSPHCQASRMWRTR